MIRIALGQSSVSVSRVVLGCMFPARMGPSDIERVVHAALAAGITSFDTAPLYDFHRGEELLGRALRGRLAQVQLLTKAGLRWDDTHGRELFSFTDAQGQRRVVRKDSRPQSLRMEVEASLKRLGSDVLDLVQIHQPDEDTPIALSIEALAALQDAGQLRAFGVSNYDAAQLTLACQATGAGKLASLQSEYSLLQRWPERELLPLCTRNQVSFLAYAPLAQGVLAGRSTQRSAKALRASRGSRYEGALERVALRSAVQGTLSELAQAHHASSAQVALAWLLAQPGVSAVIVGASSVAQVREVAAAAELNLPRAELSTLGAAFARVAPLLKLSERLHRAPLVGKLVTRVLG